MKKIMITVSGQDKPGIIAKVSGLSFARGCNLEDVSMTLLEGQFAMMMTACSPVRRGHAPGATGAGSSQGSAVVFGVSSDPASGKDIEPEACKRIAAMHDHRLWQGPDGDRL